MTIGDLLLPEFDHEMQSSRKVLERLPESKYGWKPHPKSMSMGALGTHVANLVTWANRAIEKNEHDVGRPGSAIEAGSRGELLALFDRNVAAARQAIAGASDEMLEELWTFRIGGKPVFTLPRHVVVRSACMNHIVHHRAQLCVYLRLNDVPVPAIYGPSADEEIA
jgi:uncharacterized damage-inducible protein DinB